MWLDGDTIEFYSIPGWEWEVSKRGGIVQFLPDEIYPPIEILKQLPAEATEKNSKLVWRATPQKAIIK